MYIVRLAWRVLGRRPLVHLLLSATLAVGLTAYVIYGSFMRGATVDARARVEPIVLPAPQIVRVDVWALEAEARRLNPDEPVRLPPLGRPKGSEAGDSRGELASEVNALTSIGVRRLLGLAPDSVVWRGLELVRGRLPVGAVPGSLEDVGQMLVPEALAQEGIDVGSQVTVAYLGAGSRPRITAAHVRPANDPDLFWKPLGRTYTVVGVYRPNDWLVTGLVALDPTLPPTLALLWPGEWASERLTSTYGRLFLLPALTPETPARLAERLAVGNYGALGGAVFLTFVFVNIGAFTMLFLRFLERKRELAILKSIGLTSGQVARLFVVETAVLAAVGIALGYLGAAVGLALVAGQVRVALLPNASVALQAAIYALGFFYLANLLPIALARAATVTQLLFNQPIRLYYQRISRGIHPEG